MIFLYTQDINWKPSVLRLDFVFTSELPEECPKDVLGGFSSTAADMIAARPVKMLQLFGSQIDD